MQTKRKVYPIPYLAPRTSTVVLEIMQKLLDDMVWGDIHRDVLKAIRKDGRARKADIDTRIEELG